MKTCTEDLPLLSEVLLYTDLWCQWNLIYLPQFCSIDSNLLPQTWLDLDETQICVWRLRWAYETRNKYQTVIVVQQRKSHRKTSIHVEHQDFWINLDWSSIVHTANKYNCMTYNKPNKLALVESFRTNQHSNGIFDSWIAFWSIVTFIFLRRICKLKLSEKWRNKIGNKRRKTISVLLP